MATTNTPQASATVRWRRTEAMVGRAHQIGRFITWGPSFTMVTT